MTAQPEQLLTAQPEHLRAFVEVMLSLQETVVSSSIPLPEPDLKHRLAITADLENLLNSVVLPQARPDVIFEVGSNRAAFSLKAKKMLPGSRVIAFEANADVFAASRDRLRAEGVEFHNLAVGNRIGTVEFHVPINPQGRTVDVMGSVKRLNRKWRSTTRTVQMLTLDAILEAENIDPAARIAMWIDVEGAVDEVLEGAERALQQSVVIYTECETRPVWQEQSLASAIVTRLLGHGFFPIARDVYRKDSQYNVIFVRGEVLDSAAVAKGCRDFFSRRLAQLPAA